MLLAEYKDEMQMLHEASSQRGAARYSTDFQKSYGMLLSQIEAPAGGAGAPSPPTPLHSVLKNDWVLHYLGAMEKSVPLAKNPLPQILVEMKTHDEQVVKSMGLDGLLTAPAYPAVSATFQATARAEVNRDGFVDNAGWRAPADLLRTI